MQTLLSSLPAALLAAALAFAALNWAAGLALARFWERLQPQFRRASFDMWARYEPLKDDAPRWYGVRDWDEFLVMAEEFRKTGRAGNQHEPFTEWRSAPFRGAYWNYSPHGFRHVADQGPWPPDPQACNILFFGGSTAVHQGPDGTSIASRMQAILREALPGRKVCLYNFGRTAFFSTQEVILYQRLLESAPAHALAVFFHGTNDFFFHEGLPATFGLFAQALEESNRANWEAYSHQRQGRPKWRLLGEFFRNLPLFRLLELLLEKRAETAAPRQGVDALEGLPREANLDVVRRLMHNHAVSQLLARHAGARAVTVVQPVPAYGYDLSLHRSLSVSDGLGGHARCRDGYAALREQALRPEDDSLLWLADMQQEATECLYLDGVHYTADFSREIAGRICAHLLERGLLDAAGQDARREAPHAL